MVGQVPGCSREIALALSQMPLHWKGYAKLSPRWQQSRASCGSTDFFSLISNLSSAQQIPEEETRSVWLDLESYRTPFVPCIELKAVRSSKLADSPNSY